MTENQQNTQNNPDDFENALNRAKRIKSDAGEIEKTSVYEAIELDKYRRAREAQQRRVSPFGQMARAKISPPGTN